MRTVAISMVRNEVDIVEAFVRHTLAVVDHIVILDNGSHDGTVDVLRALIDDGLPIELIEDGVLGKRQSARMSRLMHDYALAKYGADWVLPIDADEFVVAGQAGLVPRDMPTDRPLLLPWRSYVPDATDDPGEHNPVIRIRHRLSTEGWPWAKVVVPRRLAEHPGALLEEGNHGVSIDGIVSEAGPSPDSCLAHFPIRGPGQYVAKVAIGYLNRLVLPVRRSDWGFQYRGPFERLKDHPSGVAAEYRDAASRYALPVGVIGSSETEFDPINYRGGKLKHTPPFDDAESPVKALVWFAETTAGRCAAYSAAISDEQETRVEQFDQTLSQLYQQLHQKDDAIRSAHAALDRSRELISEANQLRMAAQDRVRAVEMEQAAERERVAQLDRERCELREASERTAAELRAVLGSWSWRVGRTVVAPARWMKRQLRGVCKD